MQYVNEEVREKIEHTFSDYYLYETHMHTSTGSACGSNTGAEMARAYKEAGYAGIIVTDHFFYGNTAIDRSLPWTEWAKRYVQGFYDAKEEGDKIGLSVFFGWESCYDGMEFLIYGLSPEWLIDHPEIRDCSIPDQYRIVSEEGGLVIQAHPFREADYIHNIIQYPDHVDGFEVLNISNGYKSGYGANSCPWDDAALAMAKEHNLLMTAGSDQHSTSLLGCGMVFRRPLIDVHDFISAVRDREGILMY